MQKSVNVDGEEDRGNALLIYGATDYTTNLKHQPKPELCIQSMLVFLLKCDQITLYVITLIYGLFCRLGHQFFGCGWKKGG